MLNNERNGLYGGIGGKNASQLEDLTSQVDDLETLLIYDEILTLTIADGSYNITGNTFTGFGTQKWWRHTTVNCAESEFYKVSLKLNKENSGVLSHIILCTDAGLILQSFLPYNTPLSTPLDDFEVTIPSLATKMHIISYTSSSAEYLTVKKRMQKELKLSEIVTSEDISDAVYSVDKRMNKSKTIQTVCRLGYDVYSASTPPEQSIESYKLAYKNGYRVMLCDLRLTSDGYFIGLHDESINSVARNLNGSVISGIVNIADITLSQADGYDFGIYKGVAYTGTKILRIADMLKFCKKTGCLLFIELKVTLSNAQCDALTSLIKLYGMEDFTVCCGWYSSVSTLSRIASNIPKMTIGTNTFGLSDSEIETSAQYKTANNKVIVYMGTLADITATNAEKLIAVGLDLAYTEVKTTQELNDFVAGDYSLYLKYVASTKWIIEDYLTSDIID